MESQQPPYDSRKDTITHIKRVQKLLTDVCLEFAHRAVVHDQSKLESPEKEYFDEFTPKLAGSTYGSEEYYELLEGLKPALEHHYANNTHHPEAYPNGINGMTLYDIVEMFMDWKAASERHDDGDIHRSIRVNKERFGISDQLCQIFTNTALAEGWREGGDEGF